MLLGKFIILNILILESRQYLEKKLSSLGKVEK